MSMSMFFPLLCCFYYSYCFIRYNFFSTTLQRGAGIRTHVSKVEPNWDLRRTLYQLSYSAAAAGAVVTVAVIVVVVVVAFVF